MSKYTNKVLEDRESQYGDPAVNLGCAANLISHYMGGKLGATKEPVMMGPHDVAMIMCLLKIARIATGPQYVEDNYEDLQGYAELACKLAKPQIEMATATGWPD